MSDFKRLCPECGSANLTTERRPNGESRCIECGYIDLTSEFDRHNEAKSGKEKDQEITKLKNALEVAKKTIGFYADKGNWFYDFGMYQNEFKSIAEEDSEVFDIDGKLIPKHYGGKRAREAQKQIKEIMEG